MGLDRRKEIQSVKSAWSSFHSELKDHVLPTPLGNNLGQTIIFTRKRLNLPNSCVPIIAHPDPCCLFVCGMLLAIFHRFLFFIWVSLSSSIIQLKTNFQE